MLVSLVENYAKENRSRFCGAFDQHVMQSLNYYKFGILIV